MTWKRTVPVILVSGAIIIGVATVLAGLFANEKKWDRETVVAAAKYDGTKLIEELASVPEAKPLGYLEMKTGPLQKNLSTRNEAWVRWEQHWATRTSFSEVVDWHREKLAGKGGTQKNEPTKASARFAREQWEIVLEPPAIKGESGFVRRIEWNRDFPSSR